VTSIIVGFKIAERIIKIMAFYGSAKQNILT
jgi:hypothetical protein